MRPIALFDLDGSLADYDSAMRKELTEMSSPGEVDIFNENLPHIAARAITVRKMCGFWESLKPLPDGLIALQMAEGLGYEINILTKGPQSKPSAWSEKISWVRKNLGNHPVHITANKGMVYGRILYDDWPEYALDWLKWRKNGLVIMPESPWNKNFSHEQVIKFSGSNLNEIKVAMKSAIGKFQNLV